MSNHVSNSEKAAQHKNSNLTESLSIEEVCEHKEIYLMLLESIQRDPTLVPHEIYFLNELSLYSYRSGACYASTKTLAANAPNLTVHSIKRMVTSLKKKGHLFTYQIFTPGKTGSVHFYIPKTHWHKFHTWLLNKGKFKRARELEEYFSPKGMSADERMKFDQKNKEKINVSHQTRNEYSVPDAQSILPTVVYKKRKNTKENKQRIDKGEPPPPFSEVLNEQLKKSKFTKEQIEMGMKYFEANKEKITSKDVKNPVAYVVEAVKKNWAEEHVKRHEQEESEKRETLEAKRNEESLIKRHRQEARALKAAVNERPDCTLNPRDEENSLIITAHGKNISIPYGDENFSATVERLCKDNNLIYRRA